MELNFNELRELLAVMNQTDIAEFTLKSGDFELVLRKSLQTPTALPIEPPALERSPVPTLPASPPPASIAAAPPAAPPPRANDRLLEIVSPMVGTFYRAPAPDEPSFVEVGDRIRLGQTVCIVEAMKVMNEIEAEVVGEVVEVLAKNGEPVEYGQPLIRVNPN